MIRGGSRFGVLVGVWLGLAGRGRDKGWGRDLVRE